MATSRTEQYALDVVSGKIVAGPHVRNACRRHLDDLKKGHERGLFFSHDAENRVFRFYENLLYLSEGQFAGKQLTLEPAQAFIIGCVFGWQRTNEAGKQVRRFRRAYIEMGKGNGKSPLAGGAGLYGLIADGEAGAEIYAAAAKKEQAGILFRDAVKMVRSSPPLSGVVTFSGGVGREYNMAYLKGGSFFRPVSRDAGKTGSGPRPHFVLADEVHELPDRAIIEMLERGFKFREQPLLFMITNSGSDRNSVCWEEHEHAVKVAAGNYDALTDPTYIGEVIDDSTFSYVCALDEGDDPLNDPSCWIKANPLLGVTITNEYLADIVKQAKAIPGKLNNILRLHFCTWTDADKAWMTRAALEPCLADINPKDHEGKTVYVGLDLSQSRDITAKVCVAQTGKNEAGKPEFAAWLEAWTPGDTIKEREVRDKQPYTVWRDKGFLQAPPGENINFTHVAQALADDCHTYNVKLVAYDRYAFRRFEEEFSNLGMSVQFIEHPQGGVKKGKPPEELKIDAEMEGREAEGLWMPGSLKLLEEAILEKRIKIQNSPVMVSALMSAVVEEDRWGNAWLQKTKSTNKIDAAVALCMAVGAANLMPEKSEEYDIFFL